MSFLKKVQTKRIIASDILDEHHYGEFLKALLKKGYLPQWDENGFSTKLHSGYRLQGSFSYNESKIYFRVSDTDLVAKWRVLDDANRAADSVFKIDNILKILKKTLNEVDE